LNAMTAIELRSEIIELIKRTDDVRLLEWLRSMLSTSPISKEQMEDMMRVADLSDEDIAAGRTHTIDEVKRWMDEQKRKA